MTLDAADKSRAPTNLVMVPAWVAFLGIFAFLLCVRWPLHFIHILPGFIEFRPDVCLVPLAGLVGGPVGAFAVFSVNFIGDHLFGTGSSLTMFNSIGQGLFALSTWLLWSFSWSKDTPVPHLVHGWRKSLRFLVSAFPGAWIAAAWLALGSEWGRMYPFAYVFGIVLAQNLLFLFLLGPPFYEAVARGLHYRRPAAGACPLRVVWWLVVGGVGAGCAGVVLSVWLYGLPLFHPVRMGATSGAWMKTVVSLLCMGPWVAAYGREIIEWAAGGLSSVRR